MIPVRRTAAPGDGCGQGAAEGCGVKGCGVIVPLLDGESIVTTHAGGEIKVWQGDADKPKLEFAEPSGYARDLVLLPSGKHALICGYRGVGLWDLEAGKQIKVYEELKASTWCLALLPGGVLGPYLSGLSFDRLGTYQPAFTAFAVGNLLAFLALTTLPLRGKAEQGRFGADAGRGRGPGGGP